MDLLAKFVGPKMEVQNTIIEKFEKANPEFIAKYKNNYNIEVIQDIHATYSSDGHQYLVISYHSCDSDDEKGIYQASIVASNDLKERKINFTYQYHTGLKLIEIVKNEIIKKMPSASLKKFFSLWPQINPILMGFHNV